MLALAHKIQNAIDRGVVRDRAEGNWVPMSLC